MLASCRGQCSYDMPIESRANRNKHPIPLLNYLVLSQADEQKVKLSAKHLFKKLSDNRKDLPESYDVDSFRSKIDLLMNHFIDMAVQGYGWIAPLREIEAKLGFSRQSALRYLQELDREGVVKYDGKSIVTPYIEKLTYYTVRRIQLVGSIPCGTLHLCGRPAPLFKTKKMCESSHIFIEEI